ncbi:MAG TPA: DUF1028 domain-containing protein [Acidimicrobiales bacterium]|nr:DUF1028 domain-containing protein [Acidimicrobiales bacterium]
MTYSIVARDPDTGEIGVAVQSCFFAVGSIVCWARAGVGAVATQALAEVRYGPRCLELLASGASAANALAKACAEDPSSEVRQVAVVDANGGAAAHTGAKCIDEAGGQTGAGYSVQANIMKSDRVWPDMAHAFESASGRLEERMMASLRAAESAGGDARGKMSAALLVVDGTKRTKPWQGMVIDVRVDDHPEPLDELERLVKVSGAFRACDRGEIALSNGDPEGALREASAGLAVLPDEGNLRLLRAGALMAMGRTEEGFEEARALIEKNPNWGPVLRSLVSKDLYPVPPQIDFDAVIGTSEP